jgi:hypothetical protein
MNGTKIQLQIKDPVACGPWFPKIIVHGYSETNDLSVVAAGDEEPPTIRS